MIDTTGKEVEDVISEMFDALCKQGQQCQSGPAITDSCVYGDGKGNHCAIGLLLDPEDEHLMGFGSSVESLVRDEYGELGVNEDFLSENKDLLVKCQAIHDAHELKTLICEQARLADHLEYIPMSMSMWVLTRVRQITSTTGASL